MLIVAFLDASGRLVTAPHAVPAWPMPMQYCLEVEVSGHDDLLKWAKEKWPNVVAINDYCQPLRDPPWVVEEREKRQRQQQLQSGTQTPKE
uniref:hypothetical protein n=1 Tax=Methylobacterium sp. B34 TaxID=95563 RepID=UPI000FE147CA|nr:hypothetical protein [Methylobacterium sp. B34]